MLISVALAAALPAAERAIEVEAVVKAPVPEVWKAWTTTDGVKTFFAPEANVDLRVNGPYEIFFNPLAQPGLKGADGMRVIGFQENKMLIFTWSAPPQLPEARTQQNIVIVRLEPVGTSQTMVKIHHVGWGDGGEWDKSFDYFSKAWPFVLANLTERFEKGPKDWTSWLEGLKKVK